MKIKVEIFYVFKDGLANKEVIEKDKIYAFSKTLQRISNYISKTYEWNLEDIVEFSFKLLGDVK